MAALEYEARAVGIEADPLRVLITRIWIRLKGLEDRVDVIWGNFFNKDLSVASVVTVYQRARLLHRSSQIVHFRDVDSVRRYRLSEESS